MKKISLWAKHHQWSARLIIIFSFCLLTIAAIITGMLLEQLEIIISPVFLLFALGIYFVTILLYPLVSTKRKLPSLIYYRRQKLSDALLTASTFLMLAFISNDKFQRLNYFPIVQAAIVSKPVSTTDSTVRTYKSIAAFSASLKDENGKSLKWKERRKMLKEQVRAIKKSKEPSQGAKVALIVLSVIAALGLIYLVAALACSISCGGSEAAAVIVGMGGTALVIFLLVITIRAILGRKKKPKKIIIDEPMKST